MKGLPILRAARAAALSAVVVAAAASPAGAQASRREVNIPAGTGITVLPCDLHLHTVFSDGGVWPTVRIEEAWRDGLDGIALSDHIEYIPHKDDIPVKHGRSYRIAAPSALALDLLPIRAAEITRKLPPGHFNARFIENVAASPACRCG